MVKIDISSLYASELVWFKGCQPLSTALHSSNEPKELLPINVIVVVVLVVVIIVVITVTIIITSAPTSTEHNIRLSVKLIWLEYWLVLAVKSAHEVEHATVHIHDFVIVIIIIIYYLLLLSFLNTFSSKDPEG